MSVFLMMQCAVDHAVQDMRLITVFVVRDGSNHDQFEVSFNL